MESTSQLGCVLFSQFNVTFPTLELCYKCFYFSWRYFSFVVCCITYGNNAWNTVWKLRFVFDCHCDPFFILSQPRYLFVRCSYVSWWRQHYVIFWYVPITYGNDVKLHFIFICHCNVFLISSRLRYLFLPCSYVFWWR